VSEDYKALFLHMQLTLENARLRAEVERLKNELEQDRVRLAGCGVAALGYVQADELKPGDYGHSASLDDVMRLRLENERLRRALERILDEVGTSTLAHKIAREALAAKPESPLSENAEGGSGDGA
jgi:regulator of replication initiation timing